jgi:hypothetical protein
VQRYEKFANKRTKIKFILFFEREQIQFIEKNEMSNISFFLFNRLVV